MQLIARAEKKQKQTTKQKRSGLSGKSFLVPSPRWLRGTGGSGDEISIIHCTLSQSIVKVAEQNEMQNHSEKRPWEPAKINYI